VTSTFLREQRVVCPDRTLRLFAPLLLVAQVPALAVVRVQVQAMAVAVTHSAPAMARHDHRVTVRVRPDPIRVRTATQALLRADAPPMRMFAPKVAELTMVELLRAASALAAAVGATKAHRLHLRAPKSR